MNKTYNYKVEHTCPNCGETCYVNKHRLGKTKSGLNFCSVRCNAAYSGKQRTENAKKVSLPCDYCGTVFEKLENKVKHSKKHYCSLECCDNHKKVLMKNKGNHRFGVSQTEELKQRKREKMKGWWKDEAYKARRKKGFEEAMKGRDYWFGADPETRDKVRRKLIENYYGVPYGEHYELMDEKNAYYRKVWEHTNRQNLQELTNYEKRGKIGHSEDPYHLDHIIPISYGYKNDIPPEVIGDIENLQFIPAIENVRKSDTYNEEE